ncbi:MAG: hypothetical protein ABI346_05780 [Candidatus Baltobacteraceae bacterium]
MAVIQADAADARRSRRIFVAALLLSALVHLLGFLLYAFGTGAFSRAHLLARARPTPEPLVYVTTSNATTIRKRSVPRPVPRRMPRDERPAKPVRPQRPQPPQRPQAQPRARTLHELAKLLPRAAPNPPKTVRATAPPRVALAEKPAPISPQTRTQTAQTEQVARVERDLEKALVAMRRENDPLNNVRPDPAVASKRYDVQMRGALAELHDAQGSCYSVKEWQDGPYDYYYETCNVLFDNGHSEVQSVPWPIRYPLGRDPLRGDLGGSGTVPLPGPLPGFHLAPGQYVSKELREYAKAHGADI